MREGHRRGAGLVRGVTRAFFYSLAVLVLGAPAAVAHIAGKAIPKITIASISADPQGGLTHEITVTIVDADSGAAVSGARVSAEAEMTVPHSMKTLPLPLSERDASGVYTGRLRYPMPAEWTLRVSVEGPSVQQATAEIPVSVKLTSQATPSSSSGAGSGPPASGRPSVLVQGRLSTSDILPVASLVLHATFAIVWASATLLLVLAAGRRSSRWIAPEIRRWVLRKRSPVRMAAVAGGVLLVVTGVANGMYAAPFRLLPTPSSVRDAMAYPFGTLYLLILAGKIVVLGALVIVNRMPALPANEATEADTSTARLHAAARLALGADAVLFPLLLVLITLLRYVHVLAHVSLAVQ